MTTPLDRLRTTVGAFRDAPDSHRIAYSPGYPINAGDLRKLLAYFEADADVDRVLAIRVWDRKDGQLTAAVDRRTMAKRAITGEP